MTSQQSTCGPESVEAYLSGELTSSDERAFEEHLESCESCRAELQERAAEPGLWTEARILLSDEQWFREAGSGFVGALSGTYLSHPEVIGDASNAEDVVEKPAFDVQTLVARLAPTDDPAMLGRLGSYEISGVIGFGGMGTVLKGFDPLLNRVVAIKVLAPHLANSGAARRRFSREAQAAAAVTHDNVVDIYGVSEAGGLPYLVMPYLRGPSLQSRIDATGPFSVEEILRIGLQISAGLAAAHGQGLVHRDIKPSNIVLSDGIDRLVIMDFGSPEPSMMRPLPDRASLRERLNTCRPNRLAAMS